MNHLNEQYEIGIANVTEYGIYFADEWYSSHQVIKNRWFEEAKYFGGWKIPVLFAKNNPNTIIIFNDCFIDVGFKIS